MNVYFTVTRIYTRSVQHHSTNQAELYYWSMVHLPNRIGPNLRYTFSDTVCINVYIYIYLYEGAHCVNRGCVALTLISKFRVIPQLEQFRFFSYWIYEQRGNKMILNIL